MLSIKAEFHLFAVKEDDKLYSVDEGQQRAKQSSRPDHRLAVDQSQNTGGNNKLLPAHQLRYFTGPIVDHHPKIHDREHAVKKCINSTW